MSASRAEQASEARLLYIKTQGFLFVCLSELFEELASRRDTQIDMQVSNDKSTIMLVDLTEIFTPLQKNFSHLFYTIL